MARLVGTSAYLCLWESNVAVKERVFKTLLCLVTSSTVTVSPGVKEKSKVQPRALLKQPGLAGLGWAVKENLMV